MKRILTLAVICFMVLNSITLAAAATDYAHVDVCAESIRLSGRFYVNKNQPITIWSGDISSPDQIGQTFTERFGYFSYNFDKTDFVPGNTYTVSASCLGTKVSTTFYYSSESEVSTALDEINGAVTSDSMKIAVDDNRETLGLELIYFDELSEEAQQTIYELLTGDSYSTIDDFKNAFYDETNRQYASISGVVEFYVSPDGKDENDGLSTDTPFKTVTRAKEAVRRSLYLGNVCDHIVYLMEGDYYLSETLRFNEYDSGTENNKIIYKNYADDVVSLIGSKVIDNWVSGDDGIFTADIGSGLNVDLLYADGVMQTMARYPNRVQEDLYDGYLTAGTEIDNKYQIGFTQDDGIPVMSSADLEAFVCDGSGAHSKWYSRTVPASIDYENYIVTLESNTSYSNSGKSYYLQGALEFLDADGEFYYDSESGLLYYKPYGGAVTGKEISIPLADNIISFEGSGNGTYAHDIELNGLTIRNSGRTDYLATNTAYTINSGNGVLIHNSSRISIKNCTIHDVGGSGVYVSGSSSYNEIAGNEIYNTASHGVAFVGKEGQLICQNNKVDNNIIHDTGLLSLSGAGVHLMHSGSGYNYVTHNKIYRTMRYAIRAAGSTDTPCLYPNYIEYNDVSEANMGSNDTGVIEVTHQQGGTAVRNNWIHGVQYAEGLSALFYIDELNSNVIFENNVISDISLGEHATGFYPITVKGENHQIKNNHLINIPSVDDGVFVPNGKRTATSGNKITNNLVYNCGSEIYFFVQNNTSMIEESRDNIYYNASGDGNFVYKYISGSTVPSAPLSNIEIGGMYQENPVLSNETNADYRLEYGSPALAKTSQIDLRNVGVKADYGLFRTDGTLDRLFINEENPQDISYCTLEAGETKALQISARMDNGRLVDLKANQITFVSDKPNVASVDDDGIVTARRDGTSHIVATVQIGDIEKSISYTVVVGNGVSDTLYVTSITYADENGNSEGSEEFSAPLYAYVNATNYGKDIAGLRAILGVYSDNSLFSSDMSDYVSVAANQAVDFKLKYETPFDKIYTAKLMLWKEELVPVCESVQIKSE